MTLKADYHSFCHGKSASCVCSSSKSLLFCCHRRAACCT